MNTNVPQHVVIVMDGNGRWAEERGLPRIEGHKAGVTAVRTLVQECLHRGIACLSLFAFSSENWARPIEEVNFLMELFLQSLEAELSELQAQGVRMRFSGNRCELSPSLQAQMLAAEHATQDNQRLTLNIAVNYGGKWDIAQAAKTIAKAVAAGQLNPDLIDEALFERYLDTYGLPEPDLFIRTSGEHRISNFFLWQLAYTELYFSPVYWPDFDAQHFEQALASFASRKRRFGQISNPS